MIAKTGSSGAFTPLHSFCVRDTKIHSSTADLTPIPINRNALTPESPVQPQDALAGLRGRVEQQVDAIAGSANKVISGVVDTSFGVLRSLLPGGQESTAPIPPTDDQRNAPWNSNRPGFGLLRRQSGFSIASLAASLPGGGRDRSRSVHEESGQQLVTVSRPGSVKSAGIDSEDDHDDTSSQDEEDEEESDGGGDAEDGRSIRSFESMMKRKRVRRGEASGRKSLSDRLAAMSGLSRHGNTITIARVR